MTTLETVVKLLIKQLVLHNVEITPQSTLIGDLGADSLDMIEITMVIEDEFNIGIDDEKFTGVSEEFTVQDVVDIVEDLI